MKKYLMKAGLVVVGIGAIAGMGAGIAQAAPGDVTHGSDGYSTIDLGTGYDPILFGAYYR